MTKMLYSKDFERALKRHKSGDLVAAAQEYAALVQFDPPPDGVTKADAYHMQGLIAFQNSNYADAGRLMRDALTIDKNSGQYWRNLGRVLHAAGDLDNALDAIDQAQSLGITDAEIKVDRAEILIGLGRHCEAATDANEALVLKPDLGRAYLMLGWSRFETGDVDGAQTPLNRAVAIQPDDPLSNFHRARLLQETDDLTGAAEHYSRALAKVPTYIEALNNLGNVRRAIDVAPDVAVLHMNLSGVLQEIGDDDEASRSYDRALSINPDLAEARRNRALLWLKKGRLIDGFREYEWRWKTKTFQAVKPPVDAPEWNGGTIDGALVFWSEQGVGDVLQFVRYAPEIKKRLGEKGRVVVVAPGSLQTLLRSVDGVDDALTPADPMPDARCQLPMMSAPYLLVTRFDNIPADCPYISVSNEVKEPWKVISADGRLDVGLVWSGDDRHINDHHRFIPAGQFLPLVGVPGVHIHLLQAGPASDQANELIRQGATHLGHKFSDFECTAGAIAALDLVISVDTAVAHLAGAMWQPVWIPVSTVQDWRWFEFLEDSPWYPSARLFRQMEPDDWSSVIDDIRSELMALSASTMSSKKA